jgi:hypothetical protein
MDTIPKRPVRYVERMMALDVIRGERRPEGYLFAIRESDWGEFVEDTAINFYRHYDRNGHQWGERWTR